MNTTGIYKWSKTENGVRQVTPEITKPLYNVIIFNTLTNERIMVMQIVEFFDRESFIQEMFDGAVRFLNGEPNCCYEDKVIWL